MAFCDYMLCEVCGSKVHYDAEVNYFDECGTMPVVLCADCAKTHRIVIEKIEEADHDARGGSKKLPPQF